MFWFAFPQHWSQAPRRASTTRARRPGEKEQRKGKDPSLLLRETNVFSLFFPTVIPGLFFSFFLALSLLFTSFSSSSLSLTLSLYESIAKDEGKKESPRSASRICLPEEEGDCFPIFGLARIGSDRAREYGTTSNFAPLLWIVGCPLTISL